MTFDLLTSFRVKIETFTIGILLPIFEVYIVTRAEILTHLIYLISIIYITFIMCLIPCFVHPSNELKLPVFVISLFFVHGIS